MSQSISVLLALLLAVTGITRDNDPALMEIAQQRAVEVSCEGCFSHDGMRAGTWEVLAWNQGFADPAATAVQAWQDSPTHWAILSNPDLTRIGCGHVHTPDGRDVFACVLQTAGEAPVVAPLPEPTPRRQPRVAPPTQLPDTAMETP